ncbi:MAG TPA: hypothetical protein VH640_15545 [Bryobacteraceae bacterium]
MTISLCSGDSSSSAVQSQSPKNQTQKSGTTKQEQAKDTVEISAQALNQLKGIDLDGDGR